MKPEQQEIAIAEASGVPKHARFYALDHGGMRWWTYPTRQRAEQMFDLFGEPDNPIEDLWVPELLPDYINDLNATHAVIDSMSDDEFSLFTDAVIFIIERDKVKRRLSAGQTAEAVVRAFGKWEESQ